jgi:hypothetical protein
LPKDSRDWRLTVEFVLGPMLRQGFTRSSVWRFAKSERDVDAFAFRGWRAATLPAVNLQRRNAGDAHRYDRIISSSNPKGRLARVR